MTLPRCEATGKARYTSAHRAKRQAKNVGNRIRVYACTHCGDWHVTSETASKRRRRS